MSELFPTPEKKKYRRKDPWEQKHHENKLAYSLFEYYLHSENRSLEETAEYYKKDLNYIVNLSKKNNWEERVLAYEQEELNKEIEITPFEIIDSKETTIEQMRERHFKLADFAEFVAMKGLYFLDKYVGESELARQSNGDNPKPPPMTPEQIIKLADFGAKLKRLTMGEASSITQTNNTVDCSKLSDEELTKLKELAEKTRPAEDDNGDN